MKNQTNLMDGALSGVKSQINKTKKSVSFADERGQMRRGGAGHDLLQDVEESDEDDQY